MSRFSKLGKAIGQAIVKDQKSIESILERNGVDLSKIQNKQQLSDVFIESMFKSKAVAKDFYLYAKNNEIFVAFTGLTKEQEQQLQTQIDALGVTTNRKQTTSINQATPPITPENNNSKGGFLQDVLNLASTIFLSDKQATSDDVNEVKTEATSTINDDYNAKLPDTKVSNYVLYGALGLVVFSTGLYFLMKNKK